MNARPDPRNFGRRSKRPLTGEQLQARFAAGAMFVLFMVSLAAGLTVASPGASGVLIVVAFGALFVGMVAAHEGERSRG